MAFSSFKTLINVGKNTVNDYKVPATRTIEKNKDFEVRIYEKTKFVVIKYKSVDKGPKSKEAKKTSSDKKEPNDQIMNYVWKMMKYTQGENKSQLNLKFYMPVFVHVETLSEANEQGEKDIEVKIMVALPPEYQLDSTNSEKTPLDPPEPNDPEITFEIIEEFKCYVASFGGFAGDDEYQSETNKLRSFLKTKSTEQAPLSVIENRCICISYDPPFKMWGRRNEVILIAS
jgi:hypothetical protein